MTTPEGSTISVLVADDDPLVRRILRMALESQGYQVAEASDVHATLALANDRLDLVVLDINMPGGTVQETICALRKAHPDLPLLVLSGESMAPRGLPPERADFAHKPIDLDDFLSRLRHLLEPAPSLSP